MKMILKLPSGMESAFKVFTGRTKATLPPQSPTHRSEVVTKNKRFEAGYREVQPVAKTLGGGILKCHSKISAGPKAKPVAVKWLHRKRATESSKDAKDVLAWEGLGMDMVRHHNVLRLIEPSFFDDERAYLVTELCDTDMNLFTGMTGDLSLSAARSLFIQMASAVQACHDVGIAHRDVKLENFFVKLKKGITPEAIRKGECLDGIRILLGDFGFWCRSRSTNGRIRLPAHNMCGSLVYGAPEALLKAMQTDKGYDAEKADIYSLGVCLFLLVCGFPCWESNQSLDDPYNVMWTGGAIAAYWEVVDYHTTGMHTDEFKDLFSRMVSIDPLRRPTIAQVMSHPWVTGKGHICFDPEEHVPSKECIMAVRTALAKEQVR